MSAIRKNIKHRDGYTITETIIDGDIWTITEEYRDDEGNVIYIYDYCPTIGKTLKQYNERKNSKYETKINKKLRKNRRVCV